MQRLSIHLCCVNSVWGVAADATNFAALIASNVADTTLAEVTAWSLSVHNKEEEEGPGGRSRQLRNTALGFRTAVITFGAHWLMRHCRSRQDAALPGEALGCDVQQRCVVFSTPKYIVLFQHVDNCPIYIESPSDLMQVPLHK